MMDTGLAAFRAFYEREHATTLKVLRAYPAEHAEFKPSERSNSAKDLSWTFVAEENMLLKALRGEAVMGSAFPKPPATLEATIDLFESQGEEILRELSSASDVTMRGKVAFPVAPKTMGEYSTSQFVHFMMFDQIHHRGQLSVHMRMVGAHVPSIYGPTADEPWT